MPPWDEEGTLEHKQKGHQHTSKNVINNLSLFLTLSLSLSLSLSLIREIIATMVRKGQTSCLNKGLDKNILWVKM